MSSPLVLGLIPARGGSKGVPGKNLRQLLGKSLIQRTFETAQASRVIDRIILSTDDPSIQAHALEIGLEAPFLRPDELSGDSAPMIDVVQHALSIVPADIVVLLQPTSPLRTAEHIQLGLQMLTGDADSVCSVVRVPLTLCPHYVMKITESGSLDYFLPEGKLITRRQDVPQAYTRDGTLYIARRSVIEKGSFYGERCLPILIDDKDSLSIDTLEDWAEAERRLSG